MEIIFPTDYKTTIHMPAPLRLQVAFPSSMVYIVEWADNQQEIVFSLPFQCPNFLVTAISDWVRENYLSDVRDRQIRKA